jgi:hypothetical protein
LHDRGVETTRISAGDRVVGSRTLDTGASAFIVGDPRGHPEQRPQRPVGSVAHARRQHAQCNVWIVPEQRRQDSRAQRRAKRLVEIVLQRERTLPRDGVNRIKLRLGVMLLKRGDDATTSKLIRQILGAVSEFDKAMIVAKLRGARDRARRQRGKCEGRKSYAEAKPELVALAKQLKRELPRPSLRDISGALFNRGYATPLGKPYSASAVQSMLG